MQTNSFGTFRDVCTSTFNEGMLRAARHFVRTIQRFCQLLQKCAAHLPKIISPAGIATEMIQVQEGFVRILLAQKQSSGGQCAPLLLSQYHC